MPDIRHVISDIYNKRVTLVAKPPDKTVGDVERVLAPAHCIQEKWAPVALSYAGRIVRDGIWEADLACQVQTQAAAGHAGNARLLYFEDDTSCLTEITRAAKLVISTGWSGCLYSVYDAGGGVFKCAHTARPVDAGDIERYSDMLTDYAHHNNWRFVQSIPTRRQDSEPLGSFDATVIITRVHYNVNPGPQVRSVRCRLRKGKIFSVTRWIDS